MLAKKNLPVFRVRSIRGVLTMKELREFAAFAEGLLGKSITVEGFTGARQHAEGGFVVSGPAIIHEGDQPHTTTLRRSSKSAHQFPREGGLAFWPHLRAYHRHLWPQVRELKIRGTIVKSSREDSSGMQHLKLGQT